MSRAKRYVQRKAVERLPAPAMNAVGKAVLAAVDRAVEQRWDAALAMAAEAEGDSVDERIDSIVKRFRRELGAMGAASGAVAAAPGIGTASAAAALVADVGWFAMRATDLIMAIGAANGYTLSTAEERRAWVLSVLAFGEEAAEQFTTLLHQIDAATEVSGQRVSARLAGLAYGDAATLEALRRVNTNLATTVVTRYGSRRSLLTVGKLLPFGVGAAVGGGANYAMARAVGTQARRFFDGYEALAPPPPLPGQVPSSAAPPPFGGPRSVEADNSPTAPTPPPPRAGAQRLPNPPAKLSDEDKRNSVPTEGRPQ
jgi:hypothetical protein